MALVVLLLSYVFEIRMRGQTKVPRLPFFEYKENIKEIHVGSGRTGDMDWIKQKAQDSLNESSTWQEVCESIIKG